MKLKVSLCLLILATVCVAQEKPKAKPSRDPKTVIAAYSAAIAAAQAKAKPYTCVAGQDEQCASDIWYSDYLKYQALLDKYTAPQEIRDQLNGWAARLNEQIPHGFKWDKDKQRFVKMFPTVTSTPAQPPAATPEPEKK